MDTTEQWERISKWAMKFRTVTIAKYMVCGQARYIRWEGDRIAGIFDSADAAKGID
jgi:hypothetical protein